MAAGAYNPSAGEADREIPSVHGLPNIACLVSCRPVGELVSKKNKTKNSLVPEERHLHMHVYR